MSRAFSPSWTTAPLLARRAARVPPGADSRLRPAGAPGAVKLLEGAARGFGFRFRTVMEIVVSPMLSTTVVARLYLRIENTSSAFVLAGETPSEPPVLGPAPGGKPALEEPDSEGNKIRSLSSMTKFCALWYAWYTTGSISDSTGSGHTAYRFQIQVEVDNFCEATYRTPFSP